MPTEKKSSGYDDSDKIPCCKLVSWTVVQSQKHNGRDLGSRNEEIPDSYLL